GKIVEAKARRQDGRKRPLGPRGNDTAGDFAHPTHRPARGRMSPELQIIATFLFFLVLLTCGMAVPFAIAVPAIFYLLLQGGLPSLNSLGLVSWGSMNSFVLTCVPLFMLMAEILRVSGLCSRIYGGGSPPGGGGPSGA